MDKDIEKKLVEIVGKENFAEDLIELVPYAYDASDHDHRPEAVAWPINTEQVSKILLLANQHRFAAHPEGRAPDSLEGQFPFVEDSSLICVG